MHLFISGGGPLKQGSSQSQCGCWQLGSALLTADRWKYSLSYHFLRRQQSYHISGMFTASPRMKQYKRCATCGLIKPRRPKSPLWTRAQPLSKLLFSLTFHIFLSSRAEPLIPSSTLKGGCSRVEALGDGGVMSSLPLGWISLIKIKQYGPEWQSNAGGGRQRGRWRARSWPLRI